MHEVLLPFENKSDTSKDTGLLPFMAGVVIDVDNDGSDEVFLGGGRGQPDGLLRYDEVAGEFVDISAESELFKTSA